MRRFEYRKYPPAAAEKDKALIAWATSMELEIETWPNSREKSLALTKLEEAVMWARKALRGVE